MTTGLPSAGSLTPGAVLHEQAARQVLADAGLHCRKPLAVRVGDELLHPIVCQLICLEHVGCLWDVRQHVAHGFQSLEGVLQPTQQGGRVPASAKQGPRGLGAENSVNSCRRSNAQAGLACLSTSAQWQPEQC